MMTMCSTPVAMQRFTYPLFILLCLVAMPLHASPAEQFDEIGYREFFLTLTSAERKIPVERVVEHRFKTGGRLPTLLRQRTASRVPEPRVANPGVYKIEGEGSAEALITLLNDRGVAPIFVSKIRALVVARLDTDILLEVAESPAVSRVSPVMGPSAQGATLAAAAHRLEELRPENKPGAGDPALDGTGVVIGLISLPFKQTDLDTLDAEETRIVPSADNLHVLSGEGTALDSVAGSQDALYLLQLIYDIAPGAQVVMASPGLDSIPEQMGNVIDLLVAGQLSNGVPPANIIIDDLFYPDQNPFELDEVSRSIATARDNGVLYITSAGDAGHYDEAAPTTSVYLSDFDGIDPPDALLEIDKGLDGWVVQSFGGDGFLSVTENLNSVCVFWNEKPVVSSFSKFIVWIYDASDQLVSSLELSAPGGCTTGAVSQGYKLVLDQGTTAVTGLRLMVTGVRTSVPAQLAYTGAIFDDVTTGSIRGHAASPDALTVAASDLCADGQSAAYVDCSVRTIAGFSSDGESEGTARFFWELDESGAYSAISGGLAVLKPDLAAAGQSTLFLAGSGSTSNLDFYGTSASAAVVAGIGALYWQYAEGTLGVSAATRAEAVRDLLEASTLDDSSLEGRDLIAGRGIVDAPKPLIDDAVIGPTVNISMESRTAGATLSIDSVAVAASAGAVYTATCTNEGAIADWTDRAVTDGSSHDIQGTPETEISCTVTGTVADGAGGEVSKSSTASVVAGSIAPTTVSVSAESDRFAVAWSTDSSIINPSMLTVVLTCSDKETGELLVDNVTLTQSPYVVSATAGQAVECAVSTLVSINGAEPVSVGEPVTRSFTVEEEVIEGLPIWLLYEASKP